jgi:hypothetical protein
LRRNAERFDKRLVVGVLHQRDATWTIDEKAQHEADQLAQDARLHRRCDEGVSESGESIDRRARQAERRDRIDHDRLDSDTVNQDRLDAAMNATQITDGRKHRRGRDPAARKADRMQHKAFAFNCGRAIRHVGRDMHIEPGGAGGARHRQAMQKKRPILGDHIEQARSRARVALRTG